MVDGHYTCVQHQATSHGNGPHMRRVSVSLSVQCVWSASSPRDRARLGTSTSRRGASLGQWHCWTHPATRGSKHTRTWTGNTSRTHTHRLAHYTSQPRITRTHTRTRQGTPCSTAGARGVPAVGSSLVTPSSLHVGRFPAVAHRSRVRYGEVLTLHHASFGSGTARRGRWGLQLRWKNVGSRSLRRFLYCFGSWAQLRAWARPRGSHRRS